MNKEELREKRSQAVKSLNDVKAILGLDEMYIDELEKELKWERDTKTELAEHLGKANDKVAELEKACDETQELLDKQIEATYKLDKENTELRDNYEQYKAVAEPEIKSLKEENAELKEKLKPENCLKLLAKEGYVKFTCENGNEHDQLIKAKELIEDMYDKIPSSHSDYYKDVMERAKQFLSEVEK